MAEKEERHIHLYENKRKKFPLGTDVDKEEIFNYPYLTDDKTISFIKEHGHIMFIIRGPNSTLKATLSEMIMTQYPTAQHCCADHYFSKTFSPPSRNKETLKLSHDYCVKKVEAACIKNESPIIVQNTHIRKSELQKYLDLAAVNNYTVIMAITLYKFNVTPKVLERINPDGLNLNYFYRRLKQWEDILPLFTGWFLSPNSADSVLKSLKITLSILLSDGKFCRAFNCYDNDDIWNYFDARRNLYCIAGYSCDTFRMKEYYLSDLVQECYGKSYCITIHGYLITQSGVVGLVHIDKNMEQLLFEYDNETEDKMYEDFSTFNVNDNINEYKSTVSFGDVFEKDTVLVGPENDDVNIRNYKFIHIAQRKQEPFSIVKLEDTFLKTVNLMSDDLQYIQLDSIDVCRLPNDKWLVKLPKKMSIKTLFTGLYI